MAMSIYHLKDKFIFTFLQNEHGKRIANKPFLITCIWETPFWQSGFVEAY